MPVREKFMIVAKDTQDNTVVVGPIDSPPDAALIDEIENWGWTILHNAVPVMTLGRARWDERERRLGTVSH